MISLLAGKPNPECFPFSSITITLKESNEKIVLTQEEMDIAFQYALPGGVGGLIQVRMRLFVCPESLD